ncbi:uncharacterized protein A1O9_11674 [Exophiala aquamarina CBS 119918]|uniref:Uncharacterized protein n=1 Tax=Exophiala aquamarina CBS 119918 TaxID=1182545 RepID=A0A072NZH5_9EURO|nr:uncharacterized protein A1O9_11674 [Exophiala aquamarina CBS 119918]KEF52433.1 hypothetical protein A1O9_11674 [Exophiala aquamarina CBS 119918]
MSGRSLEKLKKAMAEIEAAGGLKGQLSTLEMNVTDENSIQKALEKIETDFGQLDVLINNAAVGNNNPSPRIRFEASFQTNLLGPVLVSEAFRPLLLKSRIPYSIYVTSAAGSIASEEKPKTYPEPPNSEAYKAMKAALNMVAVCEYQKYKGMGLKVFAFCPGFVVSNLRGHSDEMRNPGGLAGDPKISGQSILSILEGERDASVGKFIHKDGLYDWYAACPLLCGVRL